MIFWKHQILKAMNLSIHWILNLEIRCDNNGFKYLLKEHFGNNVCYIVQSRLINVKLLIQNN